MLPKEEDATGGYQKKTYVEAVLGSMNREVLGPMNREMTEPICSAPGMVMIRRRRMNIEENVKPGTVQQTRKKKRAKLCERPEEVARAKVS
jgi:hypothetical protein